LRRETGQASICVVIPVLNEEETVGQVVMDLPPTVQGYPVVKLVVDNNSTDRSAEIAEKAGARVVFENRRGKGAAMMRGVQTVAADIYAFIDGDATYPARDLEKIVSPIINGQAEMVVGSRLQGQIEKGSLTFLNRTGNRIVNWLLSKMMDTNMTDSLSGFRGIRKESLEGLVLFSGTFGIEIEMTVEAVARGLRVMEIPISYRKRVGSRSKLRPFSDGVLVLKNLLFLVMHAKPFYVFSRMALALIGASLVPIGYVLYEKLVYGEILHLPSVVLSTLLIISGILMLALGMLAELITDTRRRVEFLVKKLSGQRPQ